MVASRSQKKAPYQPTAPVRGGLRAEASQPPMKLSVQVSNHRLVKLLPIYQRSCAEPALESKPGFVILSLRAYGDADVVVVERLSDIDGTPNEQLAHTSGFAFTLFFSKQKEFVSFCGLKNFPLRLLPSFIAMLLAKYLQPKRTWRRL